MISRSVLHNSYLFVCDSPGFFLRCKVTDWKAIEKLFLHTFSNLHVNAETHDVRPSLCLSYYLARFFTNTCR